MENLEPTHIDPRDLPAGFQAHDPNKGGGGAGAAANSKVDKNNAQVVEEQRQAMLQQVLTPEALERLNRIKLVKEQKAKAVENGIISMAMSGKLAGQGKINEGKLIEMLERGNAREAQQQGTGSISIQRKKYALDSDDEEEDDDDL